ncbi:MAG TPA: hypothetical protein ACFYEF_01680 [Candidatus Wunengus sp. YC63]|uniref:hypothetical protein n=1 Tax=Candidatus Wunengus sp. YC63 TaxID=3367699 RepID=UPI0040278961
MLDFNSVRLEIVEWLAAMVRFVTHSVTGMITLVFFVVSLIAIWFILRKVIKVAIMLTIVTVAGYAFLFFLYGEKTNEKLMDSYGIARKTVEDMVREGTENFREGKTTERREAPVK